MDISLDPSSFLLDDTGLLSFLSSSVFTIFSKFRFRVFSRIFSISNNRRESVSLFKGDSLSFDEISLFPWLKRENKEEVEEKEEGMEEEEVEEEDEEEVEEKEEGMEEEEEEQEDEEENEDEGKEKHGNETEETEEEMLVEEGSRMIF
jgi:hypothetical protein